MNTDEKLLSKFIQGHTGDVLLFVENLDEKEISELLESLPIELSALLLSQMDRYKASRCLEKMHLEMAVELIEKLPLSISEVLLRQLDTPFCNSLLDALPRETSILLQRILKYPKDVVGAHINPLVFTLGENQTVSQALEKIKKSNPVLYSKVFVIGRDQLLTGFIDLKDLITTDANANLLAIVNKNHPKIAADITISSFAESWGYDASFSQLPVVDPNGTFLGTITKESLSNIKKKKRKFDHQAIQASSALGDLYQIGISSLFRSAGSNLGNQNLNRFDHE